MDRGEMRVIAQLINMLTLCSGAINFSCKQRLTDAAPDCLCVYDVIRPSAVFAIMLVRWRRYYVDPLRNVEQEFL